MCSLTAALVGLSTGVQMMGQKQQMDAAVASANAQGKMAAAQAQAAYQNAAIQNRKGEAIAEQYAQQQRQLDARRRLVLGQQAASAGASGIQGGLGSSLDMIGATDDAWHEDSTNLLSNQRNATFDNYVQEVNLRNQGNAHKAQEANFYEQAKQAKRSGRLAMFGTLLSGASSMASLGGAKTAGTQTSAGLGNATAPTAAGYRAVAMDTVNSGLNGYGFLRPQTVGTFQGQYGNFGPKIRNPYRF